MNLMRGSAVCIAMQELAGIGGLRGGGAPAVHRLRRNRSGQRNTFDNSHAEGHQVSIKLLHFFLIC